jgi:Zn-dependent protease with chaperone function
LEYSNPEIPEGINAGKVNPLKEFAQLTVGVLLAAVALFWLLGVSADYLAGYIPFSYEEKVAEGFTQALPEPGPEAEELQRLVDRLVSVMELPQGMGIQVSYKEDPETVNAFATLGGQLVVFSGLTEKLPNENALAMVLAHEIAHVKLRHPIRSLGRAVVVGLAIASASGSSGNTLAGAVLGDAGLLTTLTFTRHQEEAADAEALRALERLYGHVNGSLDLYRVLLKEADGTGHWQPAFLRTHPLTTDRIGTLRALAESRGWRLKGPLIPLPKIFVASGGSKETEVIRQD